MQTERYRTPSEALDKLAYAVLNNGRRVGSRQGEDTLELSNVHFSITHPMQRALVVPGRRAKLPAQIAETVWVLAGRNDIGWLSNYLPRAADFSDDGETWRGGYGPRLRRWGGSPKYRPGTPGAGTDQLAHVIRLLRSDATTRRAVISLYDPAVDTDGGKDIPCNNWLVFEPRGDSLDLLVGIRSNDLWWGWSGINAFEWSALLEIVASMTGFSPGQMHFSIASLHLYQKHWSAAAELGDPVQPVRSATRFEFDGEVSELDDLFAKWFDVERQLREDRGGDHSELIDSFPEPMLQSWLRVLADWWTTTGLDYMRPLRYTALEWALEASPGRPKSPELAGAELVVTTEAINDRVTVVDRGSGDHIHIDASSTRYAPVVQFAHDFNQWTGASFVAETAELHEAKHAAYGDSWRKRGELFSILPNIGRKVDRLVIGGSTPDESIVDTATDLLVYLVKYRLWLLNHGDLSPDAEPAAVEAELCELERRCALGPYLATVAANASWLDRNYTRLLELAEQRKNNRDDHVQVMATVAYRLARHLWLEAKD